MYDRGNMRIILHCMKSLFLVSFFHMFGFEQNDFDGTQNKSCCYSNNMNTYAQCIQNSIWVVPPQTLLAYTYAENIHIPVSDQTVWVINEFNQGYFFGQCYTAINQTSLSQRRLVGSVTPTGDVYITFYAITTSSQDTDLVNGIGKITFQDGQCVFTMQMSSSQNDVDGLIHWSYMISVKPGDPFYNNLPGQNMSVPQFLQQFQ